MASSSSSSSIRQPWWVEQGEPAVEVAQDCSATSGIPYADVLPDFPGGSPYSSYEEDYGPGEVTVAFSEGDGLFRRHLENGVVRVTEAAEDQGNEEHNYQGNVQPLGKGLEAYGLRAVFQERIRLGQISRSMIEQYGVTGQYVGYAPEDGDTPTTPPPMCTAVYGCLLRQGMRFPLHPFVRLLLREYNLAICNLTPNSWLKVYSFLVVCAMIKHTPTLTLWRNLFRLTPSKDSNFGPGWWAFRIRTGYKVVLDQQSNVKNWRGQFMFVYCRTWDIPLVPNLGEPNLSLNFDVPPMNRKEAVVALLLETKGLVVNGDAVQLPMNWIPNRAFLEDERKLCTIGLGFRSEGMLEGGLPHMF